jgi:Ca2+-binding EF-hand superfamily protein
MKGYFNSLDEKKCGSIGIDELEELMLSIGLFETREEVKALVELVDEDKTGKIEFDEFLSMIQNDEGRNDEIVSFFKSVIGGKLKGRLHSQTSMGKSQSGKFS